MGVVLGTESQGVQSVEGPTQVLEGSNQVMAMKR